MNDAGGSRERLYSGDFGAEEMKGRRARVASAIGASAFAIVQGAAKNPTHDLFRQANDFYYLTGVEVPHAYLLIEGKTAKALLFLPHRSRELADREGELLSAENGTAWRDALGVDEVLGVEALAQRLEGVTTLYTPYRQGEELVQSWDTLQRASQEALSDPWDGRVDRASHFLSLLRSRCRRAELRDLSPTLDALRLVKSPREVELMRVAGRLAGQGIIDAMRCTKPGVMEYQLDAVIRYRYLVEGSRDVAYRSIVAGGANAWYGHYNANDCPLRDGELLLLDTGPEYRYYTSDITRMWPVNGTYTPVQKELYGFIVEYHKVLLGVIRAGRTEMEIRAEAARVMAPVVAKTRFSKEIYAQAARRTLDFAHLTHSVGMSVHDVGTYKTGAPIPAGLVFALDPQLIIPEEKLYVRVEDTVVVTDGGVENLNSLAPLELPDVERTMREQAPVAIPMAPRR